MFFLGQSYRRSVVLLPALTIGLSVLGAMAARVFPDVAALVPLQGNSVLRGEMWRLFTWPWFSFDGLSLILGGWALLLFGRDLAERWGSRRYLFLALVLATLVGALTSLVGLAWREVGLVPHAGPWPIVSAMAVSWGTLFSSRQILLFFAIPSSGQALITITIAVTFIFGALNGFPGVIPEALAIGVALAYLRVWPRVATEVRLRRVLSRPRHLRSVETKWHRVPGARARPDCS